MLEIIAGVVVEKSEKSSADWAKTSVEKLKKADRENVFPGTYISLDMSDQTTRSDIYGLGFQPLLKLKQKYDPENVFKNALPLLEIS